MTLRTLLDRFDLLMNAPESVPTLRGFILQFGVQGRLSERDPDDTPADVLLEQIQQEWGADEDVAGPGGDGAPEADLIGGDLFGGGRALGRAEAEQESEREMRLPSYGGSCPRAIACSTVEWGLEAHSPSADPILPGTSGRMGEREKTVLGSDESFLAAEFSYRTLLRSNK